MKQDTDNYYLLFESWSLDSNQWSMVMDGTAVLLAVFGVLLGFYLYRKQRKDNSIEAFDYFQSSLPELIKSIESAIVDLAEFNCSLDLDEFVHPILSASLNDKFLGKINLVHLNRYYSYYCGAKLSNFKQLLVDSNFFGNYHNYISKEINFFKNTYRKEKRIFDKWRLLCSKYYLDTNINDCENNAYKEFYTDWIQSLNRELDKLQTKEYKDRIYNKRDEEILKKNLMQLSQNIKPFVATSQTACKVDILAINSISAHNQMIEMKIKIREVIGKDITRFEIILANMKVLLELDRN